MAHGMWVKMKQYSTLWSGCWTVMTKQELGYYVALVSCSELCGCSTVSGTTEVLVSVYASQIPTERESQKSKERKNIKELEDKTLQRCKLQVPVVASVYTGSRKEP